MVARGDTMTQAQMDDLADLANLKMPAGDPGYVNLTDPFEFAYIDNDLAPPANLSGEVVYTGTQSGPVDSWYLVRVYAYQDILGRRHYSGQYAQAGVKVTSADMLTEAYAHWTWDAVAGADGYIICTTYLSWNTADLGYYPTGNMVFPRWNDVSGAEEFDQDDGTVWLDQPPCGFGAWARTLSLIHFWAIGGYNDAGSYVGTVENYPLVSGPWVVSVGETLRPTDGYYSDIEYWFPSDGSDVVIEHVVELASKLCPCCEVDVGDPAVSNLVTGFKVKSADAGTLRLYMRWGQTDSGSGWTHSVSVTTGTATITTETWTEIDDFTLELYLEVDLVAAENEVITTDVTAAAGTIMAHIGPGDGNKGLIFDNTLWDDTKSGVMLWGDVYFDERTMTPVLADAIHPTSNTYKATAVEQPDYPLYTFQGVVFMDNHAGGYLLHDDGPVLKAVTTGGVWVAVTKPVFAEHTFLDIDLPSYNWVGTPTSYAFDAGISNSLTSMPRGRNTVMSRAGESYNTVEVPIANVAALYPVIRDTATSPTFTQQNEYFTGGDGFPDRPIENYTYQTMPGQNRTGGEDFVVCTSPRSGQCVFQVTARLAAQNGTVPVATSDTDVKVGTFLSGAFVEYETITILTGQSSASMDVFWPVLEVDGSFVGWQCDEAVDVFARVNFMPQMVSDFHPGYDDQSNDTDGVLYGDFSGFPYRKFSDDLGTPYAPKAVLRDGNNTNSNWARGYVDAITLFQPSATIYNDTEAMLDLMP